MKAQEQFVRSADESNAANSSIMREHFAAEAAGDTSHGLSLLTSGCLYESVRDGSVRVQNYREALPAVHERLHRGFSNLSICVTRAFATSQFGCAEIELEGTHVGTYQGHEASGQVVVLHRAALFEFRAGKIARKHVYGDRRELSRILQGSSEKVRATPAHSDGAESAGDPEKHVVLMERHMRNEEVGNSSAVLAEMVPDGYYRLWGRGGALITDPREITAIHEELIGGLEGLRLEIRRIVAAGQLGCVELVVRGRHSSTFHGFEATGRPVEHHVLSVFSFRNDLVESETIYSDKGELERHILGH